LLAIAAMFRKCQRVPLLAKLYPNLDHRGLAWDTLRADRIPKMGILGALFWRLEPLMESREAVPFHILEGERHGRSQSHQVPAPFVAGRRDDHANGHAVRPGGGGASQTRPLKACPPPTPHPIPEPRIYPSET